MTIECYKPNCKKHSCNSGDPHDEGPFCYEAECSFERIDLPPDPEGMNKDRANWANEALIKFRELTRTDREDCLCDLLTDLMHCADRSEFNFEIELNRARGHYLAETLPENFNEE